jgi:hypothetical protein
MGGSRILLSGPPSRERCMRVQSSEPDMLRTAENACTLEQQLDLVKRAYELRKARRICIVFLECGTVFLSRDEQDPWGTRRQVSWTMFQAYIEAVEGGQEYGELMATDVRLRQTDRPLDRSFSKTLVKKKSIQCETVALTTSEPHTRAVS